MAWLVGSIEPPTPPPQKPAVIQEIDTAVYLYVTGDRVNQREGPGTTHKKLGQLLRGARVRHVSNISGWTEIVSSLGRGWMSSKYLASTKPPIEKLEPKAKSRKIAPPTSREIQAARKAIIRQSIAAYPGSCPCPYNTDRAGRRCGKRSAWSKPGGYNPICYDSDITDQRLKAFLARQR